MYVVPKPICRCRHDGNFRTVNQEINSKLRTNSWHTLLDLFLVTVKPKAEWKYTGKKITIVLLFQLAHTLPTYPLKIFSNGLSTYTFYKATFYFYSSWNTAYFCSVEQVQNHSYCCNKMSFSNAQNQGPKPNTSVQTHPSSDLRFWVLIWLGMIPVTFRF